MSEPRKKMPQHLKILIALALGAITGAVIQVSGNQKADSVVFFLDNLAKPVGEIFLNLIFMIVVPLLFSALVLGVSEIGHAKKVGKVGLYSLGLTILLSGIAVGIGLLAVNTFRPGGHVTAQERAAIVQQYGDPKKTAEYAAKATDGKTFAQTVVGVASKNPVKDAAEGEYLPFMFFSLFFGLALTAIAAEKAQPVKQFLEGIFATSLKVIEFAMKFAPIGVFGLIVVAATTVGFGAMKALGAWMILVLLVLAFHQFVVYSAAIKLIAKRSPLEFFRQIKEVMVTAFATSSSNATLPTALRVAEEDVGLPRDISSFVLTVGATANQNGTALFEGITILFLAQFFGIALDLSQQFTVMFMAILAGIGTAGVPGGSWPMIGAIMMKVGIPLEGMGLCFGVDRVLDMSRTVLNVSGDITIATCVSTLVGVGEVIPESAEA
jgi:DAACS family dicarboxylate/amino acid:cation (Na+ or H+) symporter